jgi:hypothetical protein
VVEPIFSQEGAEFAEDRAAENVLGVLLGPC